MGTNWMDPAVITRTSKIFGAFSLVLTGVAVWDVLSTLWFEWQFIRGKRRWRWPLIVYEVARLAMLLHIFSITINRNALSQVPCTELTFTSKLGDAIATVCSSFILVLRTRAVWHRNLAITIVLGALQVGQIVMWGQTFRFSKARWNPQRNLCDVLSTAPRPLMVGVWGYTMAFDLIILVLCTYRLIAHQTSTLGSILLRDGIAYFTAAFGANLVQTVMAGLQLNPVMNIMTLPFACVVSVIAATSVFRNVFTAYDSFADSNRAANSCAPGRSNGDSMLRTGARILFAGKSGQEVTANEIPLGQYKSETEVGTTVSVHKIVDVEVNSGLAAGKSSADPEKGHLGR